MRSVKSILTEEHYDFIEKLYNKIHLYHAISQSIAEGDDEIKLNYVDIEALRDTFYDLKESLEDLLEGCTVLSKCTVEEKEVVGHE